MMDARTPGDHQLRIRDLPTGERPRERLRDRGPQSLSTGELIAILLRTGNAAENAVSLANRLLSTAGGLAGLARFRFNELRQVRGLGEAKAAQVLAGLELGKRLAALPVPERARSSALRRTWPTS